MINLWTMQLDTPLNQPEEKKNSVNVVVNGFTLVLSKLPARLTHSYSWRAIYKERSIIMHAIGAHSGQQTQESITVAQPMSTLLML